jgi:hypothetical protein
LTRFVFDGGLQGLGRHLLGSDLGLTAPSAAAGPAA